MSNFSAKQSGFTLIELLVSMTIFTVVVTISVGSLLVLIDANAKAQNMERALTNVTFALDSITREVRTGRGFYCSASSINGNLPQDQTANCTNGTNFSLVEGGESLTEGQGQSRIIYRFASSGGVGRIERWTNRTGWYTLTAPDVNITSLRFVVTGASVTDNVAAQVRVIVSGTAGTLLGTKDTFTLQSTVTKRTPDII